MPATKTKPKTKKNPETQSELERLRLVSGWKVHKLAAECGVMPQTVYNWEKGSTFPKIRLDQQFAYASCLGVNMDELFDAMVETYKGEPIDLVWGYAD